MTQLDRLPIRLQQGFSLVEIMVGMVVGMLGIIIIMQVTTTFEARKGTTSGGDDAQNGGAIALYGMQKEIAQAGYGISSPWLMGLPLTTPKFTIAAYKPVVIDPAPLGPLASDPETNTILVLYGNSNTPEGIEINNNTATLPYRVKLGTAVGYNLGEGGRGFRVGDWVIPSQKGVTLAHSLFQVVNPTNTNTVDLNGAPPALINDIGPTAEPPILFNLGANPGLLAYAVINQSLNVCDYMNNDCAASNTAPAWQQLAGDIVGLKAVCEAGTGVRVLLVSRSTHREGAVVTAAPPTWNPAGVPTPVVVNPAASWGGDWDHYRYKTFETVMPIRNAIWNGAGGC